MRKLLGVICLLALVPLLLAWPYRGEVVERSCPDGGCRCLDAPYVYEAQRTPRADVPFNNGDFLGWSLFWRRNQGWLAAAGSCSTTGMTRVDRPLAALQSLLIAVLAAAGLTLVARGGKKSRVEQGPLG